jgi:hypothetical protein
MDSFIQLNLRSDGGSTCTVNQNTKRPEPNSPVISRRLNRIINRAAHKAASEFGRSGSGIFSK